MGWFQKLVTGVDLDAEQAKSDDLDAKLAAQNQAALDRGAINQTQFDMTAQNISNGKIDAVAEVDDAFVSGLNDGVNNIKGAIDTTVSFPFRLIPFKVYLIAAVVLFFYMGGLGMLKGRLNK